MGRGVDIVGGGLYVSMRRGEVDFGHGVVCVVEMGTQNVCDYESTVCHYRHQFMDNLLPPVVEDVQPHTEAPCVPLCPWDGGGTTMGGIAGGGEVMVMGNISTSPSKSCAVSYSTAWRSVGVLGFQTERSQSARRHVGLGGRARCPKQMWHSGSRRGHRQPSSASSISSMAGALARPVHCSAPAIYLAVVPVEETEVGVVGRIVLEGRVSALVECMLSRWKS